MKTIQKTLYQYAYSYARRCQHFYFMLYLEKYINKHIKYRIKSDEYEILLPLIHVNNHHFERIIEQLQCHTNSLCSFLYDENVFIYNSKRAYSYRLHTIDDHANRLVNTCVLQIDTHVLHDIVHFSLFSQDLFYKSDLTAKTKIQEHWVMRLPIYITCLTIVLVIKLLEIKEIVLLNLILTFTVYFLSLFLVTIRFHQSVSADTKKIFSETYTKAKTDLFLSLVSNHYKR